MTDATSEWKPECLCGETGTWEFAVHDQRDLPSLAGLRLGYEIPIFVVHDDGTRHLIKDGRLVSY